MTPTESISKVKIELQRIVENGIFPCEESDVPKYVAMHLQRLINGTEIEDPVDKIRSLVCELGTNSERMATCPWLLVGSNAHARMAWDIYSDLLDRINKISPPC